MRATMQQQLARPARSHDGVPGSTAEERPLRMAPPVDAERMHRIRTRLALDHCKWDPQIGDRSTLCSQPLLMPRATWERLASWSERLAAEIGAAEQELALRPELHRALGLPRVLRAAMKRGAREGFSPSAVRVMRFDYHVTTDGWRVSEVNSDVPGGFTEASSFTRLMAAEFPSTRVAGDPLDAWTRAMLATLERERVDTVALLSAPGYMEDQQVTALLGASLAARGVATRFVHRPGQLAWRDGRASLAADATPVGAIVRFYQAEWICRSPRATWERFFVGGRTPVSNHGLAALTESKRLPLLWDRLRTPMPACRALFPAAGDPRDVAWSNDAGWVVKGAYSNTGDAVLMRDGVSATRWRALRRQLLWNPRQWVLQRRFDPVPVASVDGPLFPCIGVYVIDGEAAGVYARVGTARVVDFRARDAALLIVEDAEP